jgi:hypothetical protein
MTRVTAELSLDGYTPEQVEPADENTYPAVALAPGVFYPKTGGKVRLVEEELAKAAPSLEGQPVVIDHSTAVGDEVGYTKGTHIGKRGEVRTNIRLNSQTARFGTAKAYVENRKAAGKIPEVSVRMAYDESLENGEIVARNIHFDHLSLVGRGACSPEAGCGVGLSKETGNMTNPEAAPAPTPEPAPAPAPAANADLAAKTDGAQKPPCAAELEAAVIRLKEADLAAKAQIEKLTADLAAETKARSKAESDLAAFIASFDKRVALLAKGRDLGLDVKVDADLAALEADVAKAEKIAAKAVANFSARPATGPATPPADPKGADLVAAADASSKLLLAVAKAGGFESRLK